MIKQSPDLQFSDKSLSVVVNRWLKSIPKGRIATYNGEPDPVVVVTSDTYLLDSD